MQVGPQWAGDKFWTGILQRKLYGNFCEIWPSTNKYSSGTCFKVCSTSWQYVWFHYRQKLMTQKLSYGLWILKYVISVHSRHGGKFWTGLLFVNPLQIFESSENLPNGNTQTRITPRPEARDVWFWVPGCSQLKISGKLSIWEALWRSVPGLMIFRCFKLVFKKEFELLLPPGSQ